MGQGTGRSTWPLRSASAVLCALPLTGTWLLAGEFPEQAIIALPLSSVAPTVNGECAPEEYADAVILGGSFVGWGVSPRPQSPTV